MLFGLVVLGLSLFMLAKKFKKLNNVFEINNARLIHQLFRFQILSEDYPDVIQKGLLKQVD